jgi:hypothetical protein
MLARKSTVIEGAVHIIKQPMKYGMLITIKDFLRPSHCAKNPDDRLPIG